ncbi:MULTISPECIES: bifunctional [glutamine synthetase] adenylyltransferase/[glutamine synthetase]-adenylyl-L-tyrosine phosphorylase [Thalassospira]|uniref:Bifunctional glutamine synthetase adenylyltransferase/adenylyl-removing enzyme n=2 Tax=Thalassospira TaxID=168934 RepID=A0A367VZ41_9PROT|nr:MULTISPECIES: bifunctional [glutamine synthetase] adenylyltransferase/[glutamine synthetase]-adenylyl-L-tyrosine phosphorylase [Thalassospira]MDG4721683.1 bifunctional [glutamine synthetase] adenylyltransferase/[glutamine synthetase]-adenylyl-L-tyrosine phosphorylase [Thalassospira sp. FZY0004]RCK31674.1 glutamate-ammonia-ligase adenylyltransferase [Thalassospira profundimaris]
MSLSWISQDLPQPFDAERVANAFERWNILGERPAFENLASKIGDIASNPESKAVLAALFGNSPYLTNLCLRDPDIVCDVFDNGLDHAFAAALEPVRTSADARDLDQATTMTVVRKAKRRAALVIAMADICKAWSLDKITAAISETAETTLDFAIAHCLCAMARQRKYDLPNPENPLEGSGIFAIGMGKLGACELNYSSDIDLIFLYDQDVVTYLDPDRLQQDLVRMVRDITRVMEERTGDGYVFRTDLRLRPDPASTPPILSMIAAETYYETVGQNWERAAMIKARIVGGDRKAGQEFLEILRPFVWRKHLDFLAIQDIHSIKRQINAHKGGSKINIPGHNIKLGRGGIREIEFFAQTQQLIWGGREVALRGKATCDTLRALTKFGQVSEEVRDEMLAAYEFLRTVEHRLQMINDQQTQTLPDTDDGLTALATFLGYATLDAFKADLLLHLRNVENNYAELFEDDTPLTGDSTTGNLVFTGTEDDPDTLSNLREMGFENAENVSVTVRGWHHGRYRATRSRRAREILTELMPTLLGALSKTTNPDMAFRAFDEFLKGLPAGVQLFSLFTAHPELLELLAQIAGTAPRMAKYIGRNASVLDFVLMSGFHEQLPDADAMLAELDARLSREDMVEDWLDAARRWANDQKFQIDVQTIQNRQTPHEAGRALADVADVAIRALFPRIANDFAAKHGEFKDGGLAVFALGKHGGQELSPGSDLDMVFIYDVPDEAEESDGEKPLTPGHYFIRLSQRYINALSAPTAEGVLFETDLRLRPSGSKGPLATHFKSFATYQNEEAWTWEHMALTRLRAVYGPKSLCDKVLATTNAVLCKERDPDQLVRAVFDMRNRMDAGKGDNHPWAIKMRRGGLVDLEFIAQYLQLRHAHQHSDILSPTTREVFKKLGAAGILETGEAEFLANAGSFWLALQAMLRLTTEGPFDPERASTDLQQMMARAGKCDDFAALQEKIEATATRIKAIYDRIITEPAEKITPPEEAH